MTGTTEPTPGDAAGGGWFRRLHPYLRRHRGAFVSSIVLAVIGQGLLGLLPLVQQIIVDDAVIDDRRPLGPWLAMLVGLGLVSYVFNYGRRALGGSVGLDVQNDLRIAVHRHLHRLDAARHDELSTGDVMTRATADVTLVQLFLNQIPIVAANVTLLVVALVVMAVLSPLLSLVVALFIPLFVLVAVRFRDQAFPASWSDQQLAAAVAGVVDEATSGVRVVKAFAQEDREQTLLQDTARQLFASRMRTARITARFSAALQALPGLGQLGVLALGGWLALEGRVTLGVFAAFSSYLVQLVTPVRMLSTVMSTSQQARAGAERIFELLDLEPLVSDRPGAVGLDSPSGRIELDGVSFAYGEGPPVLRDLSLVVEPGERVAIVGASGSGKSTLAHLLTRTYDPDGGIVRLDGHDLCELTLDSVRRAVGLVHEETFLFSTTVGANIAFARPDADDRAVAAAARAAQADGFIAALDDGADTLVGERGFTLSGGQRQRLALARAALANPRVLVLDDATSAVDARTEEAIHASFDRVMADRTTILIAHRASTLRRADRVVVLDGGRIVAEGTHPDLLASSALYRELLQGPELGEDRPDLHAVGALDERPDHPGEHAGRPDTHADGHGGGTCRATDPAAWPDDVSRNGAARADSMAGHSLGLATVSPGGMGGPSGFGARAALVTATPELMARVAALPAATDEPDVDVAVFTAPDDAPAAGRADGRSADRGAVGDREPGSGRTLFGQLIRPFRAALAVGIALVVVDALTTLVGPLLVRHGIDDGVAVGSAGALRVACLAFLAVQVLSWVNARVMQQQTARTAERVLYGLRARTFAHLQRLSLDFYDRELGGRIMTRMTTDVEALAQLLQQGLVTAVVSLLTCAGVVVVLFALDVRLALAAFVVLPALGIATAAFQRASGRAYLIARDRISAVNAEMQESLSGIRVTQAYARENHSEARFAELSTSYRDARMRSYRLVSLFFPFLQLLTAVAKALTLWAGASLLADVRLTEGVLVAFLIYLDQFFAPIQQLSMVFDQWVQARVSLARIDELLATPTGTPAPERPVVVDRLRGDVRFDQVRFAYGTGVEALRGVDLHVRPGESVALVGTTGAGKSTFVKLAARFYDATGGRVLIDGTPITDLDVHAFRRQIGYVPQEPFLFSGTIRSNIAYGRPEASDAEVERAARAVGAHELVAGLPDGYLTPVAERGRSLSAGQRQLLCLARAELVDPAILILDEATSNLDLATEAQVRRAMDRVSRGRTTLLIAHRLQTARTTDRVVVVEEGRLVEEGPHDELVAAGGRYAELWSAFVQEPLGAAS